MKNRSISLDTVKKERAYYFGSHMLQNRCSIRECAHAFDVSKTLVHRELHAVLPEFYPDMFEEISQLLIFNKQHALERATISLQINAERRRG